MLAGEGPAMRGSAPLRGGRGRVHPLTACAPSGILIPGTGRRTGFCRSEQRTSVTILDAGGNVTEFADRALVLV